MPCIHASPSWLAPLHAGAPIQTLRLIQPAVRECPPNCVGIGSARVTELAGHSSLRSLALRAYGRWRVERQSDFEVKNPAFAVWVGVMLEHEGVAHCVYGVRVQVAGASHEELCL